MSDLRLTDEERRPFIRPLKAHGEIGVIGEEIDVNGLLDAQIAKLRRIQAEPERIEQVKEILEHLSEPTSGYGRELYATYLTDKAREIAALFPNCESCADAFIGTHEKATAYLQTELEATLAEARRLNLKSEQALAEVDKLVEQARQEVIASLKRENMIATLPGQSKNLGLMLSAEKWQAFKGKEVGQLNPSVRKEDQ